MSKIESDAKRILASGARSTIRKQELAGCVFEVLFLSLSFKTLFRSLDKDELAATVTGHVTMQLDHLLAASTSVEGGGWGSIEKWEGKKRDKGAEAGGHAL